MPRKKKNNQILKIINIIFIITLLISIVFSYVLISTNIIPNKYLIIVITTLLLIFIGYILSLRFKKNIPSIILSVIAIILSLIELFAIFKFNDTLNFLKLNFGNSKISYEYSLIVKKDSKYNSDKDINDK